MEKVSPEDLVRKQDVLDIIEEKLNENGFDVGSMLGEPSELYQIGLAIANLPPKEKWVSVEDKLPEDYEVVLIYENGSLWIADYKFSEFFHWGITFNPTHWKPIYLPLLDK